MGRNKNDDLVNKSSKLGVEYNMSFSSLANPRGLRSTVGGSSKGFGGPKLRGNKGIGA